MTADHRSTWNLSCRSAKEATTMPSDREDRPGVWGVYRGTGEPHDGIDNLPDPPPWRTFRGGPPISPTFGDDDPELDRRLGPPGNRTYRPDDHVVDLTN